MARELRPKDTDPWLIHVDFYEGQTRCDPN
jgi:hypothetical protein